MELLTIALFSFGIVLTIIGYFLNRLINSIENTREDVNEMVSKFASLNTSMGNQKEAINNLDKRLSKNEQDIARIHREYDLKRKA